MRIHPTTSRLRRTRYNAREALRRYGKHEIVHARNISEKHDANTFAPRSRKRISTNVAASSGIALPLNGMLRKDAEPDWDSPTPGQLEAFETLKQKLVTPPMLGLPKTPLNASTQTK